MDVSVDSCAKHKSGPAALCPERLRPLHWRAEDPLESARRQQYVQRFLDRAGQGAYATDTANAKIYKLEPGASTAELFLKHPSLKGIDGITFLNGTLYVNNMMTNHIYRIPIDASGKTGEPVDISMDQPVQGPDGMRAANGKLFVAENRSGKMSPLRSMEIKQASR
jgi:sugar lactone lactonase YvrE